MLGIQAMLTVCSGSIQSILMLQAAFSNWEYSFQGEEGTFSSCQHCRIPKGSHKCGRKELSKGRSVQHLGCRHLLQEVIPHPATGTGQHWRRKMS